jgi:dTDP-4-amino-4,6-dideoxygalactose transaminase
MTQTRDAALDRKFRLLRQHAMSVSDTARHAAKTVVFEEYPLVGFNYRMTDIQAAVGRVQLRRLPDLLGQRVDMAATYTRALKEIPGLEPSAVPEYARTNFQSYAVRVTPEYGMSRDALMQALLERGISTRRGIMNAHQEAACADLGPQRLPHSEAARDTTILLPLHPTLTERDQACVIDELRALSAALGRNASSVSGKDARGKNQILSGRG